MSKQPLLVKEIDPEYQYYRLKKFQSLLNDVGNLDNVDKIKLESRKDIPPKLRGIIWATLLGVTKEDLSKSDFNCTIVDVPRCHQYHPLLNNPVGHEKLKKLLKLLLAYLAAQKFISKFLKNFFKNDNSQTLHDHLALFNHLISFHDPQLNSHLHAIGFLPDLYAIPWFLTLFTHAIPLEKIYHIWDAFLVSPKSLPLFFGLSIIEEFRDLLLRSDFNECISFFSEFPEIDIYKCLQKAISLCRITPPSAVKIREEDVSFPIDLSTRKAEISPRITIDDLLFMKESCYIIDIRPKIEYFISCTSKRFFDSHISGSFHFSVDSGFDLANEIRKTGLRYVAIVCNDKLRAAQVNKI
ncbi:RabGAP/TBC [Rozella allomycis CSF55]|uniref:RabGAP/TBC n=1 Tax=Rozella allomycis (strain CSF55) TaxID=988480 RepID=A0A4P9YJ10_ROZAC|nr:RabGAP/TBC [Rozella allomycis CSF55]